MIKKRPFFCLPWAIILIIPVFLISHPLMSAGFPVTDDGDWMIIRLSAFYQSLTENQFPVRYLGRLNYNYGYPVANFLYPGFLYLGSLFHLIGLSFVSSVKAVIVLSLLSLSFSTYFFLCRRFGRLPALAAAFMTVLSPYLMFDIYKRGSVGEVLAIAAASLILVSLDRNWLALVPISVALLILAHNSLAMVFLIALLVIIIYRKFTGVIKQVLVGVLISAFFWLPAILESRFVVFGQTEISDPFRYFLSWEYRLINPLIFLALLLALMKFRKKISPLTRAFAVITGTGYFFSTILSAPFWSLGPLPKLVQFPFRFLALEVVFGGYFVALLLNQLNKKIQPAVAGFVFAGTILAWFILKPSVEIKVEPEGFYTTNEATTTVADEYMPKWAKIKPEQRLSEKAQLLGATGTIFQRIPGSDEMDFTVESASAAIFQINKIYYPGWGVYLNGIPQPIIVAETTGMMQIPIPAGKSRIYAAFRETPLRFAIDFVSFGTLIYYYFFRVIIMKVKRRVKPISI
jgi:hypothetical protein